LEYHTSPSQRFFPLLQAVQALAPRFGTCAGDPWEEVSGWPDISMARAVLWLIFRFFPVVSNPFVKELSGLWDISLWSPLEYRFDEAKG